MMPSPLYHASTRQCWSCRDDDREQRLASHITLNNLNDATTLSSNSTALLGFCCDTGVKRNLGRAGAAVGPQAVRQMLGNLPYHKTIQLHDLGDVHCQNDDMESCQQVTAGIVTNCHNQQCKTILLGGGHDIAWAHYQGLRESHHNKRIAIVNFDAHIDMRPMVNHHGSSGTPFLQIAQHAQQHGHDFNYTVLGSQSISNTPSLFKTAKQYGATLFSVQQCINESKTIQQHLDNVIEHHDILYVTLCLDVFNAAFSPGVSAVNPQGLAPWHVHPYLHHLIKSDKVRAFDVAELNPRFDQDNRSAKLAASLIGEVIYA